MNASEDTRKVARCLWLLLLVVLLYTLPALSDINPGEISDVAVSVTPTTATITWKSSHAGSSWVYWGFHGTGVAVKSGQNDSFTTHRVTLTGLVPYNAKAGMGDVGSYDYYVATQKTSDGKWSSSGGPSTNDYSSLNNFHTTALDTSAALRVSAVPIGQKHVYPGHHLYVLPVISLLAGGAGAQTGAVAVLTSATVKNSENTDVEWQVDARDSLRSYPGGFNPGKSWNRGINTVTGGPNRGKDFVTGIAQANFVATAMQMNGNQGALSVRIPSDAPAGSYTLNATLQPYSDWGATVAVGSPIEITWSFTVYAPAAFTAKPPTAYPAIPTLDTWQSTMTSSNHGGEYWCTASGSITPIASLEFGSLLGPGYSLVGNFNAANQPDAQKSYNYDGGRVYIQIADYQFNTPGMSGYHDANQKAHWQHCAQMVLYPYDNWLARSLGAQLNEPNQHLFGTGMYYARTHDATAAAALTHTTDRWGAYSGFYGTLDPRGMRWFAYTWDSQIANEASGARGPWQLSGDATDVAMALLDMFMQYDGTSSVPTWNYHPFVLGALMESLIGQYELDAEMSRTPDPRIPLEVGKALYFLFQRNNQNWWQPDIGTLRYNPVDVPMSHKWNDGNSTDVWASLNNLVAPACAWYWSKTGDDTIRGWGDALFAATWKDNGDLAFAAKPFNQVYKWSFDFVRYRSGANAKATFLPSQNTYEGEWKDTVPPLIFREFNCGFGPPIAAALCQDAKLTAPAVNGNQVTLTWDTIKPATTEVYYQKDRPGCSLKDSYRASVAACISRYAGHYSADPEGVRHHVATLSGLPPSTTEHYVLYSQDAAGNGALAPDATFTTGAEVPGTKPPGTKPPDTTDPGGKQN